MNEEIISKEIILRYPPGSLNPIDINEHYLNEVGIINEDNKLNRGLMRIGSLGTNMIFANETQDEIRVQPSLLKIESKNNDRIELIIDKIKESFGNISLHSAEYNFDVHLEADDLPHAVFENYVKSEGLKLDVIRFRHENIELTMYSCGNQRIHLKVVIQNKLGKQLKDFHFKNDLEHEKLEKVYSNFKEQDLNISIQ